MGKLIHLEAKNNMIGLTGVARSGKDTFYSILNKYLEEKNIKSQRIALADILKKELNDFTKEKFKIDLNKCEGNEKELIRPLMFAYGKCRRMQSEGKYWTSLVDPNIKEFKKWRLGKETNIDYDSFRVNWYKKHLSKII